MEKTPDDFLKDLLEKSEAEAEQLDDDGHLRLRHDTRELISAAFEGRYHDFHRNGAPAPKMQLVSDLQKLIENTKNGTYDN